MAKKNILFIVEGEKAEVTFLKKIGKKIPEYNYSIYSYRTSVYELYEELVLDEYLDILLVLKEKATKKRRDLFDKKYTDIYLVFDFDPHYHKFNPENLIDMIGFFVDSTDKGKLYINYPMLESYRHIKKMPDIAFFKLKVDIIDVKKYKNIVHDYSDYKDINSYEYNTIIELLKHHIIKFIIILNLEKNQINLKDFNLNILPENDIKLLNYEINMLNKEEKISVINTSFFYLLDILPKKFYDSKQATINVKYYLGHN